MSDISIKTRYTKVNSAEITRDKLLELLRKEGLELPYEVKLLVNDGNGCNWSTKGSIKIEWEEVGMRATCPKCSTDQPVDTSDNPIVCIGCDYTWRG
jgi:hypothetical protein